MTDEVQSFKSKILEAMGMGEAAEVEALKSEVVSLESKIDEMQKDFKEALKAQSDEFEKMLKDALSPVAEKSEEEPEEASEEEPVEEDPVETEETETEEETEEEVEEESAEKGKSKAGPIHDNLQAEKSQTKSIYEIMGRNPDGTRRK